MSIEIKTVRGTVLYTAESAADVRAAVTEAVAAGADLRGADLGGANLGGANLYGADLRGADLGGADLGGADLRGANLRGANLYGADLYGADLGGANLYGADLRGADLYGANLYGANLYGANLRGANLGGADLRGAKNVDLVIARTRIIPDEGPVIGWKKCFTKSGGELIVKLLIPADAKRSHASGRKCRAERAEVLAITDLDGNPVDEAFSGYDKSFRYAVGEVVVPGEPFCEDMWQECASGIHWYVTRLEAVAHV